MNMTGQRISAMGVFIRTIKIIEQLYEKQLSKADDGFLTRTSASVGT